MKALTALVPLVVLAAIAAALPFLGNEYLLSFTIQLLVYVALAYSWNIIGGYAGYTHFGQVGFFGVGAYVGALLAQAGLHWLLCALCAGLAGGLLAVPLGAAMLRLKGPFFAIGMFGLARVGESLALGLDWITEGGTGLYLSPLSDLRPLYATLAVIAAALLAFTYWLDNSRVGLELLAIREDEDAAEMLGIRTTRLKVGAFLASSLAPAAVGSLYVSYLAFIDPTTAFAPMTELTTIAMVLLGGLGTVLGPLVGALVLAVFNELLWSRFPQIYLALVGLAVLGTVLFMPRGIVTFVSRWPSRWLPVARGALKRLADRPREAVRGS